MKYTLYLTLSIYCFCTLFTSCKPDELKPQNNQTNTIETSVTLLDSLGKNEIDLNNQFANLKINILLGSETTLKSFRIERKIGNNMPEILLNNNNLDTVKNFKLVSNFNDAFTGKTLLTGDIITYTVTVLDSKNKMVFTSLTYTVINAQTSVTLLDDLGKNEINNKEGLANININIKIASGASIKTARMDRKIGSATTEILFENTRMDTVSGFLANSTFNDVIIGKTLVPGENAIYTVTITDTKFNTVSSTITFKIIRSNKILVSNEFELGGQFNNSNPFKFFGLADNFNLYYSGISGSAKNNSSKIDFVYYYGSSDKNALASPSNQDGAQVLWGAEIAVWSVINNTKFKTTSLNASDFDNIKNSGVDDVFYNIDFITGTTDKVNNLASNSVFAFKTANGTIGLVKIIQVASANDGLIRLQVLCQK